MKGERNMDKTLLIFTDESRRENKKKWKRKI